MKRPSTLRRTVKLKSGGTITFSVPISVLGTATPVERAFVLDIVDCIEDYDKKNSAEDKAVGGWIAE